MHCRHWFVPPLGRTTEALQLVAHALCLAILWLYNTPRGGGHHGTTGDAGGAAAAWLLPAGRAAVAFIVVLDPSLHHGVGAPPTALAAASAGPTYLLRPLHKVAPDNQPPPPFRSPPPSLPPACLPTFFLWCGLRLHPIRPLPAPPPRPSMSTCPAASLPYAWSVCCPCRPTPPPHRPLTRAGSQVRFVANLRIRALDFLAVAIMLHGMGAGRSGWLAALATSLAMTAVSALSALACGTWWRWHYLQQRQQRSRSCRAGERRLHRGRASYISQQEWGWALTKRLLGCWQCVQRQNTRKQEKREAQRQVGRPRTGAFACVGVYEDNSVCTQSTRPGNALSQTHAARLDGLGIQHRGADVNSSRAAPGIQGGTPAGPVTLGSAVPLFTLWVCVPLPGSSHSPAASTRSSLATHTEVMKEAAAEGAPEGSGASAASSSESRDSDDAEPEEHNQELLQQQPAAGAAKDPAAAPPAMKQQAAGDDGQLSPGVAGLAAGPACAAHSPECRGAAGGAWRGSQLQEQEAGSAVHTALKYPPLTVLRFGGGSSSCWSSSLPLQAASPAEGTAGGNAGGSSRGGHAAAPLLVLKASAVASRAVAADPAAPGTAATAPPRHLYHPPPASTCTTANIKARACGPRASGRAAHNHHHMLATNMQIPAPGLERPPTQPHCRRLAGRRGSSAPSPSRAPAHLAPPPGGGAL